MTLEEKQKIIVIAEAIGWTISHEWPNYWITPQGDTCFEGLFQTFNPLKSISDAMEALNVIFKEYKLTLKKFYHTTDFEAELSSAGIPHGWIRGEVAETPEAAISLTLIKYIKEPK